MKEILFIILKLPVLMSTILYGGVSYASGQLMAIGVDNKFTYSEKTNSYEWLEPGNDSVLFYDLENPGFPKFIGSVAVENSIIGPPTNIAITPDQRLGLIANAVSTEPDEFTASGYKMKPSNFISVVDLSLRPIRVIDRVVVGTMPSGISIDKVGKFGVVANRKDSTVSILSINGTSVVVTDTVNVGGGVTAVAISPDGRKAFAVKNAEHKVAVLKIGVSGKATYEGSDIPVGLYPWAITLSQDGNRAIVTNIGYNSASDGNEDTVSILDLSVSPPRVVQHLSVGDAPEGVVISPNGRFAAVSLLAGSFAVPKGAWYRKEVGRFSVLQLDGPRASVISTIDVGSFPEGVAFSEDNTHIYVGNFASETLSIISLNPVGEITKVSDLKLPGPPGSIRVANQ
ncbi:MAG: YncE family protein [Pseudomonadales bacterium]|nr:YncE family protein [Pseudomonadales bacterium]